METKTSIVQDSRTSPEITLTVFEGSSEPKTLKFTSLFRVGRDPECQVALTDPAVSKLHLEVYVEKNTWWLRDLGTTNGTYLGKKKVTKIPLGGRTKVVLGKTGPLLTFEVEGAPVEGGKTRLGTFFSPTVFVEKYFGEGKEAGERTRLIRGRILQVERKKSRKFIYIIAGVSLVALLASGFAYWKHRQLERQQLVAENVFYELKELDLAYNALKRKVVTDGGDTTSVPEMVGYRTKRRELGESYEKLLSELGVYSEGMDEKSKAIYRLTRIFGECEIGMPDDFVEEVENYIDLWKKSPRLRQAIQRAADNNYGPRIARALVAHDVSPQFFYLALQESEFDSTIVGPPTRFGVAKGMWQFVPATAVQYGLKTGPLVDVAKVDPRDERHDVSKSTEAAAQYISDMYNTEAQASGLLVCASYNWGHNVVKGLIRQMPGNVRERNFWKFLAEYRDKIPKQTYDYVFYIFSAAVIGDNPKLWGFNMERPNLTP
jgi:membrane-bound lytic murein transglycosylase D